MVQVIGAGGLERPKKPAGWYSKAARAARAEFRRAKAKRDASENAKRAERLSAPLRESAARRLAAVRAARAVPAKVVSLNPKRPKRDRRSQAQRRLDARAEAGKEAWARRHPAAAASERRLRKERADLVARWKHKNDGTPETHQHAARRNDGALARLYETGAIDAEQLAAAEEINLVAERIAAGVTIKTASLETRVDVTRMGDGGFYERLSQVRHEMAYTRWRHALPAPAPVLAMLTGEHLPLTIAARSFGMGHKRLKRLLIGALDLWPRMLRDAVREVDQGDLDRAHARIA
jgi:hypothetical protein